MSLKDYLAKHYGSAPEGSSVDKGKKKSKKKHQTKTPPSYGINVVVDEDDDTVDFASLSTDQPTPSVHSKRPDPDNSKASKRETYKPIESTWKQVSGSSSNAALASSKQYREADKAIEEEEDEEEERPVIAEGAELIDEFNSRRQKEHELELERQKMRRKAREARKAEDARSEQNPARSQSPALEPEPQEKYGLRTAQQVKEDKEKARRRYLRQMQEAGDETSGKDADTVYRDPKTGKRLDIEKVVAEGAEKRQREEELRKRQIEWNKGLVQQREKIESRNRIESMRAGGSSSDVAQTLDAEKRARMHWDDPALQFLENKKTEKTKFPVYKGYAPPNRFNVRPGYRWDGVDRSNGFEAEYFKRQAASSARKAENYASSVADW